MEEASHIQLEPPRFEDGPPLLVAGLRERYAPENLGNIPAQWQRLMPYMDAPMRVGQAAYGLCFNTCRTHGVEYMCGFEVASTEALPGELGTVSIPAQHYAVFPHRGHVSMLPGTLDAIGRKWLPQSGCEVIPGHGEAPDFFERYSEEFDPATGMGGIEVWIPIKA